MTKLSGSAHDLDCFLGRLYFSGINILYEVGTQDFATYHIGRQSLLIRAFAGGQSCQSLHPSHTQSMDDDDDSDLHLDL